MWGDEQEDDPPQEDVVVASNHDINHGINHFIPKQKLLYLERDWKLVKKAFHHETNQFLAIQENKCYKRVQNCILEFYFTNDTKTNCNRRGIKNRFYAKYRASALWCKSIFDIQNKKFVSQLIHQYTDLFGDVHPITYQVKQVVFPDKFETDINEVCAGGIHFFLTLAAAFCYRPDLYCVFYKQNNVMCAMGPQGEMMRYEAKQVPDIAIDIECM